MSVSQPKSNVSVIKAMKALIKQGYTKHQALNRAVKELKNSKGKK